MGRPNIGAAWDAGSSLSFPPPLHQPSDPTDILPRFSSAHTSRPDSDDTHLMDQRRNSSRLAQWHTTPREPFINFVRNEWQKDQSDTLAEEEETKRSFLMGRSLRSRRAVVVYVTLLAGLWLSWRWWLEPRWRDSISLNTSLNGGVLKHHFGLNLRPSFKDMVQVKTLDKKLVPESGKNRKDGKRRLVVVGDVHGCKNELIKLLDKISFNPKSDHLVLAGDMIRKGLHSLGVIELARKLGASCVRGNHEDRVLLAYRDLHQNHLPLRGPMEDPHTEEDDMEEESFSHGDYKDRKLAKRLTHEQVKWLQDCPLILDVGHIDGMGQVVVVHAGLVPGVALDNQDPFGVMNMRTMEPDTLVPSDGRKGTPWTKVWNNHQSQLPHKDRTTVIYGHDSRRGLVIKKYTKGLDSGCVRGEKLSALVIEGGKTEAKQKVVSINCKKRRWMVKTKDKDATIEQPADF